MTLFVGDGPLNKDGKRNPDARGLMISDATVGLVKKGEGDGVKYALRAEGQVSVVGISALSLSGPISISYNSFESGDWEEKINDALMEPFEDASEEVVSKVKRFAGNELKKGRRPFMRLKDLRRRSRLMWPGKE